jgi:hypothetical protein
MKRRIEELTENRQLRCLFLFILFLRRNISIKSRKEFGMVVDNIYAKYIKGVLESKGIKEGQKEEERKKAVNVYKCVPS